MLDDPRIQAALGRLALVFGFFGVAGLAVCVMGAVAPAPLDTLLGNGMVAFGGAAAGACLTLAAAAVGLMFYAQRPRG